MNGDMGFGPVREIPGPQVFDTLPEALQDCFQSGDVQQLIQTAQSMKPEDFQYHFDRCKLSPPRGTQAS